MNTQNAKIIVNGEIYVLNITGESKYDMRMNTAIFFIFTTSKTYMMRQKLYDQIFWFVEHH